jgi:hypothetical protein
MQRKDNNPLAVDPECLQFATRVLKQARADPSMGFSKSQVRKINSTPQGRRLWGEVSTKCTIGDKFDFSAFCRQLCRPESDSLKKCVKRAKIYHSEYDPAEVCYGDVFSLCKRAEFVWTNLVSRMI